MIVKVIEAKESLDKLILGITTDLDRDNFDRLCAQLPATIEVVREVGAGATLPKIFVDDVCVLEGHYPNAKALSAMLALDDATFKDVKLTSSLFQAANDKRVGICCGVGTDVYVDPYEDNH